MSSPGSIRILLADDHPIVLAGLEQLFGLEQQFDVVGKARDGVEALSAVERLEPDVLVLDLRLPKCDGLGVLREMERRGSRTRVVLLTAEIDDEQVLAAIDGGARAVVLKEMAPALLAEAIRAVAAGELWLERSIGSRALKRVLARETERRQAAQALTARELDIARLVGQGLRNRAIAEALSITEGTVKIHLHRIFEKLALSGRLELALWAREHQLG